MSEGGVCDGDVPAEKVNGMAEVTGAEDTTPELDTATQEEPGGTTPASEGEAATGTPAPKDTSPAPKDTSPAPPVPKPKYRYDWYQTETDVCINILIKKVKKENVEVNFQEKSVRTWRFLYTLKHYRPHTHLQVGVRIEVGEDDIYNLELALAHQINLSRCLTKVYGSKVKLVSEAGD